MHRCVGVNYCILLGTCTCRMASVARSPPSLHSSHARCSKGINTSNTFLCINPNKIHFWIWNQEASIDQEYGHESNHRILRFWSKLWKNVVHFRSNVISPSHLCQVCVAHCSDIAEVLSGSNKCILYFSDKPHLYYWLLLLVPLGMRMMFFLGIQILLQTSVSDVLLQSLLWPELGDFLVTLSDWVSLLQPQNITFYGLRIYFQIRTV